MFDKNLIQSTSSWPFVEIRKLLKDRKDIISKKNKITFQTGYGPSGLPHIGTFGEVARTTMMINALNHIQKIDHELITFSDDMDGLRKVPENIPNDKILKENIDGEALKWAYNKMSKRKEERKILMVISDGAPVDDSTLSTNSSDYLETNLKNIVKWIENKTNIELLAIGIGHDVTRYYKQAIKITDVQDLGDVMINQLTDLFVEKNKKILH